MSRLLYDKNPLLISPKLAAKIGLNEAIVLQQLHYWLLEVSDDGHWHDGHKWVWNTYEEWHEQLPFFSVSTIRRAFTVLKNKKLVLVGNYNKKGYDKTNWWAIDYDEVDKL